MINSTAESISSKLFYMLEEREEYKYKMLENYGDTRGHYIIRIMLDRDELINRDYLLMSYDAKEIDCIIREVVEIMKGEGIDVKVDDEHGYIMLEMELKDEL